MTKYGLGWSLGMCRKVLGHLSQKYFFGLESESFHPNPLCTGSMEEHLKSKSTGGLSQTDGVTLYEHPSCFLSFVHALPRGSPPIHSKYRKWRNWGCRAEELGNRPRTRHLLVYLSAASAVDMERMVCWL